MNVQIAAGTDNQSPVLTTNCAGTQTVPATSDNGAMVSFIEPTATDNCGTATLTVTSLPDAGLRSGSTFPIGTTTVTYSFSDGTNTIDCSINVTVEEVAPVLTCPSAIEVDVNSVDNCTNTVSFPAATVNAGTGIPTPTIEYTIPGSPNPVTISSPYAFPIGTTTVTATATNGAPGSATGNCTFDVTVNAPEITVDNASPGPDVISGVVQTETIVSQSFTVTNTGDVSLDLDEVTVTGSGANAGSATWTIQGGPFANTSLGTGGSASFTILFDPDDNFVGTAEATVSIPSNDCDEATYTFTVSAVSLQARVYNIEQDRYYATITEAVNDIPNNGPTKQTLTISGGTYTEGMDLTNKNVTVKFGELPGL